MAYLMYRIISLLEDQRKNNLTKKNIYDFGKKVMLDVVTENWQEI